MRWMRVLLRRGLGLVLDLRRGTGMWALLLGLLLRGRTGRLDWRGGADLVVEGAG